MSGDGKTDYEKVRELGLDWRHVDFIFHCAEEWDMSPIDVIDYFIASLLHERELSTASKKILRKLELARLNAIRMEYEIIHRAYHEFLKEFESLKDELDVVRFTISDRRAVEYLQKLMNKLDTYGARPDIIRRECKELLTETEYFLRKYYKIEFNLEEFIEEYWIKDRTPEEYIYDKTGVEV